ncbi:MAG: 3-keto-5-aminohexanoate cleavage protein [Granulosicoccaceae bacterium]
MSVASLPHLMVAPNGARRTHADHPKLPVSVAETVQAALKCYSAGADGIHAHVRDTHAKHVLDAGLYKELIAELTRQVPQLLVQITTEAVGLYTPAQQRQLVADVQPQRVSVSLSEMLSDNNLPAARDFYHSCHQAGTGVQHILYSAEELTRLSKLVHEDIIPSDDLQLLFVLGRYSEQQQSHPRDLQPFLFAYRQARLQADWGLCAFGGGETDCLVAAHQAGGKMRVGFENNLWHSDGTLAKDNAERITELLSTLVSSRLENQT